jgi:hypothetical protein
MFFDVHYSCRAARRRPPLRSRPSCFAAYKAESARAIISSSDRPCRRFVARPALRAHAPTGVAESQIPGFAVARDTPMRIPTRPGHDQQEILTAPSPKHIDIAQRLGAHAREFLQDEVSLLPAAAIDDEKIDEQRDHQHTQECHGFPFQRERTSRGGSAPRRIVTSL